MEFWLSFNNQSEKLQLPVPPQSYTISKGADITTLNVNNIGEVSIIGNGKLATIGIETFFPSSDYDFCQYTNYPTPSECIRMIEKWRDSKKPIRLIITNTNINLACCIEDFSYGEQDGTGDIYFKLSLKEYRFLGVGTTTAPPPTTTGEIRPTQKETPKTYTVKSGDTLWIISKKIYGDGNKYTTLASKNNIKDINTIKVGQVLVV